MYSFFILTLICLLGWSNSQHCPTKYARFTTHHSFCLPPNRTCQVLRTGVSQQDKELIVKLHNEFRSKVAMGNEGRSIGGGLPRAADMMQMVWDDEIAAIAQKWTENCHWGHDCDECNAVENFLVGQNLFESQWNSDEPKWTLALTALYNEVTDYQRNWLDSFVSRKYPKTGHFTQIIWSTSWRVGCGFTNYKAGGSYHQYYACNYGPGGNIGGKPVYKQGQPCSSCPTNTQCSTSNSGYNSFPGLCKMNNPNTAPAFRINPNGLLFYCGASSSDNDCQHDVSGDGNWRTVNSVGGNYYSIVLKGGQSTTLTFKTPIKPHTKPFCFNLNFRKGPADASREDRSSLIPKFKIGRGGYGGGRPLSNGKTIFRDLSIIQPWDKESIFSLVFSVPNGAGEHILDLRKIMAYDGDC